jgi:hypothetical protein
MLQIAMAIPSAARIAQNGAANGVIPRTSVSAGMGPDSVPSTSPSRGLERATAVKTAATAATSKVATTPLWRNTAYESRLWSSRTFFTPMS